MTTLHPNRDMTCEIVVKPTTKRQAQVLDFVKSQHETVYFPDYEHKSHTKLVSIEYIRTRKLWNVRCVCKHQYGEVSYSTMLSPDEIK